jgi:FkbM family methyltransferase
MYDADDSLYYLETGHSVIAIEAHPAYVAHAERRLRQYVQSGQLLILNCAVASARGPVTLRLNGFDLGGHSLFADTSHDTAIVGGVEVDGCTIVDVLERAQRRPKLIKIDIEGADFHCLRGLSAANRPDFLSCEMHDGLEEVMPHLTDIGFSRFKLIDQTTFRELSVGRPFMDRLALGLLRRAGYCDVRSVRRAGRWFTTAHSSGPAPWESGGRWWTADEVLRQFAAFKHSNRSRAWLDLHAT